MARASRAAKGGTAVAKKTRTMRPKKGVTKSVRFAEGATPAPAADPSAEERAAELLSKLSPEEIRAIGKQLSSRGGRDFRGSPAGMPRARAYYARRPFGYQGVELDREQVLQLVGAVNDEKLVRLGYIAPLVDEDGRQYGCRHCPAKFLSENARDAHGKKRHAAPKPPPRLEPRQPDETVQEFEMREAAWREQVLSEEDKAIEREERELDKDAPLYLDQTAASRE